MDSDNNLNKPSPSCTATAASCAADLVTRQPFPTCARKEPHDDQHHTLPTTRSSTAYTDANHILAVLDNAVKDGVELNVTGIARRAGVDRTFLYCHRYLL